MTCDWVVTAVNVSKRLAILDTGEVLRLETMITSSGDITADPLEAVTAVAETPEHTWIVIDLREFDSVSTQ